MMNDDTFSAAGQSSSVAWTTPAWTSATAATASGTAWVGRTNYRATWHAWSHSSLNARTGSALTGAGTGFPWRYLDILKIHHSHLCADTAMASPIAMMEAMNCLSVAATRLDNLRAGTRGNA